jgi:hypothetical protein
MFKKILLLSFLSIIIFAPLVFSESTIECVWDRSASCPATYDYVLSVPTDNVFSDAMGRAISCNIQIESNWPLTNVYNNNLCCKSLEGNNLDFEIVRDSHLCSDSSYRNLLYIENDTNSRVAIYSESGSLHQDLEGIFRSEDYRHMLCIKHSNDYGDLDLVFTDDRGFEQAYGQLDYECFFKTSSSANALVSDCNAQFESGDDYEYSVWGRLWENTGSSTCQSDCTRIGTNRVLTRCAIEYPVECENIPPVCNGAILGSFVSYDKNNDGYIDFEIQCSRPWNNVRDLRFTNEDFVVSRETDCQNLVDREYQVKIDNELVKMHVYTCSN